MVRVTSPMTAALKASTPICSVRRALTSPAVATDGGAAALEERLHELHLHELRRGVLACDLVVGAEAEPSRRWGCAASPGATRRTPRRRGRGCTARSTLGSRPEGVFGALKGQPSCQPVQATGGEVAVVPHRQQNALGQRQVPFHGRHRSRSRCRQKAGQRSRHRQQETPPPRPAGGGSLPPSAKMLRSQHGSRVRSHAGWGTPGLPVFRRVPGGNSPTLRVKSGHHA